MYSRRIVRGGGDIGQIVDELIAKKVQGAVADLEKQVGDLEDRLAEIERDAQRGESDAS